MSRDILTIFTPTYNREYIISKCYESLCRQSIKDFIWLVVDDGSTDNTELMIKSFISENIIKIIYIKQTNSGKHVAHNTAVLHCTTSMFVCVDSDDYLTEDAIQVIYEFWKTIKDDESVAGLLALKEDISNKSFKAILPTNIERSSIADLYEKYNYTGETMLVFKTNVLERYLFPVFEEERFVTEAVVYDQISQMYEMKLINKVLYRYEYLEDGYSKNILNVYKANPKGYLFYYKQRIDMARSTYEIYDAVSRYFSACLNIKNLSYYWDTGSKSLRLICIPKGLWIFIKPIIKKRLTYCGFLKIKG